MLLKIIEVYILWYGSTKYSLKYWFNFLEIQVIYSSDVGFILLQKKALFLMLLKGICLSLPNTTSCSAPGLAILFSKMYRLVMIVQSRSDNLKISTGLHRNTSHYFTLEEFE